MPDVPSFPIHQYSEQHYQRSDISLNLPIDIPDLSILTSDMPWHSVAREFTYLPTGEWDM
jgi:hypothetical protein